MTYKDVADWEKRHSWFKDGIGEKKSKLVTSHVAITIRKLKFLILGKILPRQNGQHQILKPITQRRRSQYLDAPLARSNLKSLSMVPAE
jgi:hypothetical protein